LTTAAASSPNAPPPATRLRSALCYVNSISNSGSRQFSHSWRSEGELWCSLYCSGLRRDEVTALEIAEVLGST